MADVRRSMIDGHRRTRYGDKKMYNGARRTVNGVLSEGIEHDAMAGGHRAKGTGGRSMVTGSRSMMIGACSMKDALVQ